MQNPIIIKNHCISDEHVSICVPVVSRTRDDILRDISDYVSKGAYFIEFRADYYENLGDKQALCMLLADISAICTDTIVLFTIRSKAEGGECELPYSKIAEILTWATESGHIDMVDLEMYQFEKPSQMIENFKARGVVVVASHHNFQITYSIEKTRAILQEMHDAGADIAKIAMMPNSLKDTLHTLEALTDFKANNAGAFAVAISMGQFGMASRLCGGIFGSCITFSPIKASSAPGQVDFESMQSVLNIIER